MGVRNALASLTDNEGDRHVFTNARRHPAAALAAGLCVLVVVIHIKDQGGITALKAPTYVGVSYFTLEAAGLIAASALAWRPTLRGWILATGVALGPLLGYVVSRGPGLPGSLDDRGVISLVVEGALLVVSALMI